MFIIQDILNDTGGELLAGNGHRAVEGISIDSRAVGRGDLFFALRGERFDGHDFLDAALGAGAQGAVIAGGRSGAVLPDWPKRYPDRVLIGVGDTLRALQDVASGHRERMGPRIIGVTGSNGKTTTKEMAAGILGARFAVLKNEGNLNNHIGVPLTLLRLKEGHRLGMIEMGINRPGELTRLCEIARPQVGLITNIGPTHLEFLKDLNGVCRAKGEMLECLPADGVAVLNADDGFFRDLSRRAKCGLITFGLSEGSDVRGNEIAMDPRGGVTFLLTLRASGRNETARIALRVSGRHNVYNALGAAAIGVSQGMDIESIRKGLEAFRPVAMRSETVRLKDYQILNDAYNANPASMSSAIDWLVAAGSGGRRIAVLGDMLELGDESSSAHYEIGVRVARSGVDRLITLGPMARQIGAGAREAGMDEGRIHHAGSLSEACQAIRSAAGPGSTILLKGSRKMKMERLLEMLQNEGAEAGPA